MRHLATAGLYLRTVRNLELAQISHRARLRLVRRAIARWPDLFERRWRPATAHSRWPTAITPFDRGADHGSPSPEANAERVFEFLNDSRRLGSPADWDQSEASQLWRFHLGYFEWAWSFEQHPDRNWARGAFADLWREWRSSTRFGHWDAWSPYVVSLRAWVLCNVHDHLVAGSEIDHDFTRDLALSARFLERNLERDLGGNHLVKNLKALIALGAFFGEDSSLERAVADLEEELRVQVLADGGHFERSPSYHAQVLIDLIDVTRVLEALGRSSPAIDDAVISMRAWLTSVLLPDGDVPLVNDGVALGADTVGRLVEREPTARLTALGSTGYLIARPDERTHLFVDIGQPGPPTLPGHAHADCLSMLLTVDGSAVLTDTGTSTYVPGERRRLERSTAAHNTISIDRADQTEVWATFRAARLANATIHEASDNGSVIRIVGSHDGYTRLRGHPVHRRSITLRQGTIEVVDEVDGTGRHQLESNLYTPLIPQRTPAGVTLGSVTIRDVATDHGSLEWRMQDAGLARNFGEVRVGTRLRIAASAELPVRWSWTITVDGREEPA